MSIHGVNSIVYNAGRDLESLPANSSGDANDLQIATAVPILESFGDRANIGGDSLDVPDAGRLVQHLEVRRVIDAGEKGVHVPELVLGFLPPLFSGVLLPGIDLLAHGEQAFDADLADEFRTDVRIGDLVDAFDRNLHAVGRREPLGHHHAVERVDAFDTATSVFDGGAAVTVNDTILVQRNLGGLLADDAHVLDGAFDVLEVVDQAEPGRGLPDLVALVDAIALKLDSQLVAEEVVEGKDRGAEAAVQVGRHKGRDLELGLLARKVFVQAARQLIGGTAVSCIVASDPGFERIVEQENRRGFLVEQFLLDRVDDVDGFVESDAVGRDADVDPFGHILRHLGFLFRGQLGDHGDLFFFVCC
jgi:hypothetical protein